MVLDDDRVPSTIEPNIQNNRRIKLLNNSKFFILVNDTRVKISRNISKR